MKTRIIFIAMVFTTSLFFTSCKKDDKIIPKPVITLIELGHENSKIAYVGSELHIDAEIIAEGKIDKVIIKKVF